MAWATPAAVPGKASGGFHYRQPARKAGMRIYRIWFTRRQLNGHSGGLLS